MLRKAPHLFSTTALLRNQLGGLSLNTPLRPFSSFRPVTFPSSLPALRPITTSSVSSQSLVHASSRLFQVNLQLSSLRAWLRQNGIDTVDHLRALEELKSTPEHLMNMNAILKLMSFSDQTTEHSKNIFSMLASNSSMLPHLKQTVEKLATSKSEVTAEHLENIINDKKEEDRHVALCGYSS